jgi:hypothetical protein
MALPRTGMHWFRKTIPADLRQILGKREEKFSLRTKSPGEAHALHAKRAAEIAEKWARLRGHAVPDHVDIYALADEFYREMLAKHQRNPPREDFQLNSKIISMPLGCTDAGSRDAF